MGDGPELFQDQRNFEKHSDDQVALILSNHAYNRKNESSISAPGLKENRESEEKNGEFDLLGFVKLAANKSQKSEYHHSEEKLIVEFQRPERVRIVVPNGDDAAAQSPARVGQDAQSGRRQDDPASAQTAPVDGPQTRAQDAAQPPAPASDQDQGEATAVVVGYKKHTVDHEARHKHPEVLGGIFNIDTDSFRDQDSALVRKNNEERYAEKTQTHEGGSVNVGPVPLVYLGDRGTTNYYESKRVKLDPNSYVKTNMGFLPIEE